MNAKQLYDITQKVNEDRKRSALTKWRVAEREIYKIISEQLRASAEDGDFNKYFTFQILMAKVSDLISYAEVSIIKEIIIDDILAFFKERGFNIKFKVNEYSSNNEKYLTIAWDNPQLKVRKP